MVLGPGCDPWTARTAPANRARDREPVFVRKECGGLVSSASEPAGSRAPPAGGGVVDVELRPGELQVLRP